MLDLLLFSKLIKLFKNINNLLSKIYQFLIYCYFHIIKKNIIHLNNIFNFALTTSTVDLSNLEELFFNKMAVSVEYIKIQELTFLSEYFLITALFCLTLFALFSLKFVVDQEHFLIKFLTT